MAVQGMVDADWTITRSSGDIRYIGPDHGDDAEIASYATVIQFHRWLQDFADDAEFGSDDELDIVDASPSNRSTDNIITLTNGFNITATEAEHLYDGSIIQNSGVTEEIFDGIVNFGNLGVVIQILQGGAIIADDFWNYFIGGLDTTSSSAAFMTDTGQSFTTNEFVGFIIKNVTDGSQGLITANDATTVTATLEGGGTDDWNSGEQYLISSGLNSDATAGISHRFLIQTRTLGIDIAQRQLIGTNRTFERTYGEFKIAATARGNNVLALTDADDLNNNNTQDTVSGWTGITNTEGLRLIDISGDSVNEEYFTEWDPNFPTRDINEFYERMKWLTRDGSASTQNSLNGELFRGNTHSLNFDADSAGSPTTNDELAFGTNIVFTGGSGTFLIGEEIFEDTATPVWTGRVLATDDNTGSGSIIVDIESGVVTTTETFSTTSGGAGTVSGTPPVVTTGGRFLIFAFDDDGGAGNVYGQLMTGRAPVEDDIMYFGGASADVAINLTVHDQVVERVISKPWVGVSTGSALIGSYGFGILAADATASDTFFDLQNNQITPPNNVTFTIDGLTSGEDYVLVGTDNSNDFLLAQYTLNGALTATNVTAVVVNGAIDALETPSSGTIRIERDDGLVSRHVFTSFTGSTFTIGSTDFSPNNASNGNEVMTSFVDVLASGSSESMTYVFNSNRTVFIRVRDGGTAGDGQATKTFETTAVIGTNGVTATNIRTDDF